MKGLSQGTRISHASEASFIRTKLSCSELLIIRPEARLVGMGAEVVEEVHEELILPTQL